VATGATAVRVAERMAISLRTLQRLSGDIEN
jgi:hypothetical protein